MKLAAPRRLTALACAVALSACASFGSPFSFGAATSGNWAIVPSDDPTTVVAQRQVEGGVVSVMCAEDGCRALIVADAHCEVDSILPVLINTDVEAGITDGECLTAEDTATGKTIVGIVLLTEANLLLPNIVLGDDAAIAVPMADGTVAVYTVGMAGLRELLAPLKPDLFTAPGWLDEHGIKPAPAPEGMDEEEALRWQRGLRGI